MNREELYQWSGEMLKHPPGWGKKQAPNMAMYEVGVLLPEPTSVYRACSGIEMAVGI